MPSIQILLWLKKEEKEEEKTAQNKHNFQLLLSAFMAFISAFRIAQMVQYTKVYSQSILLLLGLQQLLYVVT